MLEMVSLSSSTYRLGDDEEEDQSRDGWTVSTET